MKEFSTLRAKTYAYIMDDDSEVKKAKETKKFVIKRQLMFENYKDCLHNDEFILKSQHTFSLCIYTIQINKIVLSSNDDRLQTYDRIATYPYGTNAFKVWESEMKNKILKNA